eukprot:7945163-Pyramimonas_sp.AAC.1
MNWDKTVQIQVGCADTIRMPTGEPVKNVRDAVYLGGIVSCDGRAKHELSRRIGESANTFKQLQKLWAHAAIGKNRKLDIYSSCVVSKLLYSLDSLWLLKADRDRLDAFHCRCLRQIMGIPHSYYSRISNATVLERAGSKPLSQILHDKQVSLYRKIAAQPGHSLVKQLVCEADGTPKDWALRRRRGRPRQQWAHE